MKESLALLLRSLALLMLSLAETLGTRYVPIAVDWNADGVGVGLNSTEEFVSRRDSGGTTSRASIGSRSL